MRRNESKRRARPFAAAILAALVTAELGSASASAAARPVLRAPVAGEVQDGGTPEEPARAVDDPATRAVLDRVPGSLPRADADSWKDWNAESAPPESIQPRVRAATIAYARRDLPATMIEIYAALELEPDYPAALYQLGVIYFRLRRYGDAAVAFERYVDVAPQRVGDTRALGHCYYTLGSYDKARDHYARVIAAGESSVEALRGLGLSHMRLGDVDRALASLREVVEREPDHADARTWIAQILYDEGDVEAAEAEATRARDIDPYQPRPWFLLARILFELEREEEARASQARFELLNRVTQEVRTLESRLLYDPGQRELYARLVELHRQAGNVGAIQAVFERWLAMAPTDVPLRVFALDTLVSLGDEAGARIAAAELERAGAESLLAWRRLARYFARTRDRVRQVEAEEQYYRLEEKAKKEGGG